MSTTPPFVCGRCGRAMELREGQIDGVVYCNSGERPTCYTKASWERTFPDATAAPDVFGLGSSVTCSCGETRMGPMTGHPAFSVTMRCPTCGRTVEVAPPSQAEHPSNGEAS